MQNNDCLVLKNSGVLPSPLPPRSVRRLAWIDPCQCWPLLKQQAQSIIPVCVGGLACSGQRGMLLLLGLKMVKAIRGRQLMLAFILEGRNNYWLRSRAEAEI